MKFCSHAFNDFECLEVHVLMLQYTVYKLWGKYQLCPTTSPCRVWTISYAFVLNHTFLFCIKVLKIPGNFIPMDWTKMNLSEFNLKEHGYQWWLRGHVLKRSGINSNKSTNVGEIQLSTQLSRMSINFGNIWFLWI